MSAEFSSTPTATARIFLHFCLLLSLSEVK